MIKTSIGIIGGSGFYEFLRGKETAINTPYGKPSDKILISEYAGKKIAFLPRHGKKHQYPPHKIPYRANIWALKKLGCQWIIAPTAVGSLQSEIKPGDFVVCDQFIDRTKNRQDTFFEGLTRSKFTRIGGKGSTKTTPLFARIGGIDFSRVVHISMAQPYCPELRKLAIECCKKLKVPVHREGVAVIINGPRYSTLAESRWFSKMGWQVVNMTQYPEMVLARELEMCYVNISLVTDYDAGLENDKKIKPVEHREVVRVFRQNNEKVKKIIFEMIKNLSNRMSKERHCQCSTALKDAVA